MDPFDAPGKDCHEVMDILDAYALGAVGRGEARVLERHVADCIRCWEELNKAQRTAALLALSIPMTEAPSHLGERIMDAAQGKGQETGFATGIFQRLRFTPPVAAGALGCAALAALAFTALMQFQMGDLRLGYAASMSLLLGVMHLLLAGLVFKLMRTERA